MTYSNANFTPSLKGYSNVKPFRFWCQKVLPLVYDDSLSYYELLCKVVDYLNHVIDDLSATEDNVGDLLTAYNQLQDYVNNYFTNLDVQEEINNKLDAMFEDGTIPTMIEEYVYPYIETLNNNYAELDTQINATMTTQNENIATLTTRVNNLIINNTTNLTGYNVVTVESTTAQGGSTVTENIPASAEILQVYYSGYNDTNDAIKSDNISYVSTPNVPSSTQQQVVVTITDPTDTRFNVFITYAISQDIEIAELTDIRIGYDDIVYPSAGDAVRGQVSNLKNAITNGYITDTQYSQGTRNANAVIEPTGSRCTMKNVYQMAEGDSITIRNIDDGFKAVIAGVANGRFVYESGWQTADTTYIVTPSTVGTYFVNFAKVAGGNFTPSNLDTSEVNINNIWYIRDIQRLYSLKRENSSAYVSGNSITWSNTGGVCTLVIGADIVIRSNYGTTSNNIIKTITVQNLLDAVQSSGLSTVSVSEGKIVGASFAIVFSFEDNSIKVLSPTNKEIYNNTLILFVNHYLSCTSGALIESADHINLNSALKDIDDLESDVDRIHGEIDNGGYDIPSFLSPIVDNVVETLETSCTEKTMLIAFTTDNHYGASNGTNWNDTIGTIKTINNRYKLDVVIDGGDMINGDETAVNARTRLAGMIADMNIPNTLSYATIGNHDDDSFTASQEVLLPQSQLYALVGRPFGCNYDEINGTKTYGYKDFPMYGIRLIIMDSRIGDDRGDDYHNWGYDTAQITWLRDVALDTDFQVAIFCHMGLTKEYSVSNLQPVNGVEVRTILENFVANGGTVIAWFHGHTHWDFIGQYTQVNGIHEVSTGCGRVQTFEPVYAPTGATVQSRTTGTATQELYDIIAIKPDSRTVQMIRFGAGSNRSFTY